MASLIERLKDWASAFDGGNDDDAVDAATLREAATELAQAQEVIENVRRLGLKAQRHFDEIAGDDEIDVYGRLYAEVRVDKLLALLPAEKPEGT